MKLTKENIYVDLKGKNKEDLTDLYNFLESIGEKQFSSLKEFINESVYCDYFLWGSFKQWITSSTKKGNRKEVTIEELKEILKMTRNQELIEEAKKRGYTHNNFKCLEDLNHSSNPDLDKWYYEGWTDALYSNSCGNGGKVVYKDGVWAEMIKPIETFTPVAMRCTQEQFDAIRPKLKGLKVEHIASFDDCKYLVNNLGEQKKLISNVMPNSKGRYNRETHEEWDEEIFLKACGIEVEKEYELDLSMCRIIVDNAEQSKKLQELAFELGYSWSLMRKTVTNTHARVLYFNSEDYRITFSDLDHNDSEFETFHFTDIFKETSKQKEPLNNKNMVDLMGYSVLVDNEEQGRKLQEIAFAQGFKWAAGAEELNLLGEESFQFGYGGGKVITYNYGGNHYQDEFITKKAHFNDLFETLQEKEQRLLRDLEEVKQQIEDSKIKAGDWVWNALNESYYKKTSGLYGVGERKITNPELIKLLEQEMYYKI